MEDDEAGSEGKAMCLMREFTKHFRSVDFTLHPKGIPGEAQGKSSNLKWAAGTVSERYQQSTYRKNVIVTVMDCKFCLKWLITPMSGSCSISCSR